MRVLVTGGAGYIGSHTARALAARGDDVVVLDTLERGFRGAVAGLPLIVGDAGETELVRRIVVERGVEAVVHFAALKSAPESVAEPARYFRANVGAATGLFDAIVGTGVRWLVNSSSCAVYGTPDRLPVDESAPLRPENPYAETKAIVERMLEWIERAGAVRTMSLRYFNAAGGAFDGSSGEDWSHAANLLPLVLATAAGRRPCLEIFGTDFPTPDGTAIRDYVHVLDLATAHVRALDCLAAGSRLRVVNVGTGVGHSVRDVVATAEAVTGRSIPVEERGRRAGDPAAIWADTSRAERELGWRASYGLREILESAWAWHSRHPDGYDPHDPAGA